MSDHQDNENSATPEKSCDAGLTRQEFLRRAAKAAITGGAVVAGVRVLDKFLVPPAHAWGSLKMSRAGSASDMANPYADG
jgi:hypothetical protein